MDAVRPKEIFRAVEIYAGHGEVQRFDFRSAGGVEHWRTLRTLDTFEAATADAARMNAKRKREAA